MLLMLKTCELIVYRNVNENMVIHIYAQSTEIIHMFLIFIHGLFTGFYRRNCYNFNDLD